MSKEVINFIKEHGNEVIKSVAGFGIFPSVKMAQMIIESSGYDAKGKFVIGNGLAVRKAKNYFGIKADKGWKGKSIQLSTPKDGKPVSLFRVYNSALDSLKDHTQFLLKNSRYKTSGVFKAVSPKQQIQALQKAKYSESPTYGVALLGLINSYRLTDLDTKTKKGFSPKYLIVGAGILFTGIYFFKEDLQKLFHNNNQSILT